MNSEKEHRGKGTRASFGGCQYLEKEELEIERKQKRKECFRIAMVSDFFCPNTGGVETHIYQLAKCLLNNGHKVIVLTHAYGNRNGIRYLYSGKLKVYYLPCLVIGNNYLPSALGSLPWFRKIFSFENIQIVHSHSTFSTMGHEALLHGWTLGLKTIFTDHSLFGFADAGAILSNRLVLRYSLINVDRVICVSHTSKENTVLRAGVPPSNVFVIPNAIDSKLFKPPNKNNYSEVITIVVLSRLVYRKGIDLLIQIIPELCKLNKKVRFVIGGDGPKRVDLEEMRERYKLHHRVELKGELPHDKVREVLIQGQIFLNTSLTDAFCMSIVEAACCGLHVVSTKVGGIPEVLPPEFITLAEPNPEILIKSILNSIKNYQNNLFPNSKEKHDRIAKSYNWEDVAKRTEKVYKEAIEEIEINFGERLKNLLNAGFWFGIVWIWGAALNYFLAAFLDLINPRYRIKRQTKQNKFN
uniref:phosphatidylinositol N-acetylglucosaminyltransferase n=1 Tax=Meloidogyne incognita TaxID=6306 RepID=A0A914N749_MELIC